MALASPYARDKWSLNVAGRVIQFQGDVTWTPPEELQTISVFKDSLGRGVKVDQFDQANVASFSVSVVQESGDEGHFSELAHAIESNGSELHFTRRVTEFLQDGTKIGYYTPQAYVADASETYSGNAQVVTYAITAIGYRVERKNADAIERL